MNHSNFRAGIPYRFERLHQIAVMVDGGSEPFSR